MFEWYVLKSYFKITCEMNHNCFWKHLPILNCETSFVALVLNIQHAFFSFVLCMLLDHTASANISQHSTAYNWISYSIYIAVFLTFIPLLLPLKNQSFNYKNINISQIFLLSFHRMCQISRVINKKWYINKSIIYICILNTLDCINIRYRRLSPASEG